MALSHDEISASPLKNSLSSVRIPETSRQAARKSVQHCPHIRQCVKNLRHIPLHHDVRQPARGAQRFDVSLRRLRVPLVAERQRSV